MAIPAPTRPATPAARRPVSQQRPQTSEAEYEVIEDDEDMDEIVMDPSTNELVHLTPGSSASFSSEKIETHPAAGVRQAVPKYQAHIKQASSFNPGDAASVFVGVCMVLGGWFTVVLQMLSDSPSTIAVVLGAMAALGGVGLAGFGLRQHKKILLPAVIAGALVTICLSGVSLVPDPGTDIDQVAENDLDEDEFFDPGESRFSARNQREKARKRQEQLDRIKERMDSMNKSRDGDLDRRNKRQPVNSGRNNNAADEPEVKDEDKGLAQKGSGRYAREIEDLWASVEPDGRHEILNDLEDVVEDGLDGARDNERDYWEMLESRLVSLRKFDDGNWISLDFKYGMTGWHMHDPDCVSVESDSSVKVKATTSDPRGPILSSPDMFYGPLSIKAMLQLTGNHTGDSAPQVGIVLSNGKAEDAIGAGDCVVLFDPGFENLWSGASATRDQPVSLTRLSPKVSNSSPIDLQINVCRGYVQVFGNKQLLVEKFDKSIMDAHSIRLVVLGGSSSDCSFEVSDWKVRSWNAGKPPGRDAFVEEDLMYMTEAAKDFDDIGWYHYRLALACFGTCKFEKAISSAKKAVDLGIPRENLSLIFAMENELNKKYTEAAMDYTKVPEIGNMQDVARTWHAWFVLTHPEAGVRAMPTAPAISEDVTTEQWAIKRINAALAAKRGDYTTATTLLTGIIKEVPVEYRGDTSKQLQAYQNNEVYVRERTKVPFYHHLKVRLITDTVQYNQGDQ